MNCKTEALALPLSPPCNTIPAVEYLPEELVKEKIIMKKEMRRRIELEHSLKCF